MDINKSGGDWTPAPKGEHQAVLVDWIDRGWVERFYEGQSNGYFATLQPVFQITATMEETGERYTVRHFPQYITWGKKANWRKLLIDLVGVERFEEIYAGSKFEPDDLLGTNCLITVIHKEVDKDGQKKTYANISEITRWRSAMGPVIKAVDYVRMQKRLDWQPPQHSAYLPFPGDPKTGELYSSAQQQQQAEQQQAMARGAAATVGQPRQPAPAPQHAQLATPAQVETLLSEAFNTFGPGAFMTKVGEYSRKVTKDGRGYTELNEAECATVTAKIRSAKSTEVVTAKSSGKAATDDPGELVDDDDPFSDQDAGGVPSGEMDAAVGKMPQQRELVSAGEPANSYPGV